MTHPYSWRLRTLLPAMAFVAIGTQVSAQMAAPPRRAHHALVYDETRHLVLLTGGSTPLDGGQRFQFFNDLWAFNGTAWRSLGASGEEMSGIGLAWDDVHHRAVSFGGYNGQSLGELRLLDGDKWNVTGRHPSITAAEPGLVFDLRRGRFVMFGGSGGAGANGETWTWDGSTWSKIEASGPPARQAQMMAYDTRRGVTVLFGGMGSGAAGQPPPSLGDTWEFNGTTWTRRDVTGPSARAGAGVAYDSKRGLVIIFGGISAGGFLGDTWAWDGTTWRQLATTGPEPRGMGYMAYDKARDRVVLFGGRKGWPNGDLNDTWEWDGANWKRVGN